MRHPADRPNLVFQNRKVPLRAGQPLRIGPAFPCDARGAVAFQGQKTALRPRASMLRQAAGTSAPGHPVLPWISQSSRHTPASPNAAKCLFAQDSLAEPARPSRHKRTAGALQTQKTAPRPRASMLRQAAGTSVPGRPVLPRISRPPRRTPASPSTAKCLFAQDSRTEPAQPSRHKRTAGALQAQKTAPRPRASMFRQAAGTSAPGRPVLPWISRPPRRTPASAPDTAACTVHRLCGRRADFPRRAAWWWRSACP